MVYRITTAPLIREVLKGHNAAAFAYGATGSGKTHTMLGPCKRKTNGNNNNQHAVEGLTGDYETYPSNAIEDGLMVRAIQDIFRHTEENVEITSYKVNLWCIGVVSETFFFIYFTIKMNYG